MRASACSLAAALAVLLAPRAAAQAPSSAATVRGVVFDSLAGAPLAGATVQLVDAAAPERPVRTLASDSAGRFAFAGVPRGRYVVGFQHPVLDALGLQPISRTVAVGDGGSAELTLAVPGPTRLRRAYCGADAAGGAIVGVVRAAADGAPASGATVVGTWREIVIGGGGLAGSTARREATADAGGGFVLCDVPMPGAVRLVAHGEAGDTDAIEVDVPADGLLRRDLHLGTAERRAATTTDTASGAARRVGPGRLLGSVVAADGGAPLPDVQVRVADGVPTRTNAQGEWALAGAPTGTRMLEVRAPGFLPVRTAVDVVDGAPPVAVPLVRLAAVLDTLRIVARGRSHLAQGGFAERRRTSGVGRFYGTAELERMPLTQTSDVYKYVPGLIVRDGTIHMRSAFTTGFGAHDLDDLCVPTLVVNGVLMRGLTPGEVDDLVGPRELGAVEVYGDTQVPPQFQDGMRGCGAIVVWTR